MSNDSRSKKQQGASGFAFVLMIAGWSSIVMCCASCDREPRTEWCVERTYEDAVRASGTFAVQYEGRFGRAPDIDHFYVRHVGAEGLVLLGCAMDSEGNLWRARAAWGSLPPAEELPVDIQLESADSPHFVGYLIRCTDGECLEGHVQTLFDTRLEPLAHQGMGEVVTFDPEGGVFEGQVDVIGAFNETTRFELDVAW